LWWEQSSSLIKYATKVGKFDFAAVYHEDIADAAAAVHLLLFRYLELGGVSIL
jgi:hypothetical protein